MNLNGDHLTDLLSYNKNTGRAVYSIGASPPGTQVIVKDTIAPKGWTSIVPMNLNGDGLTDLLFYNKTTGRTVYSVAAPPVTGSGRRFDGRTAFSTYVDSSLPFHLHVVC